MKLLSEEKLDDVKQSFEFADADGNGSIDFSEFARLLRVLSPDANLQQAGEGFSIIDTNSDGQIDYDEFVEWWKTVWWEF